MDRWNVLFDQETYGGRTEVEFGKQVYSVGILQRISHDIGIALLENRQLAIPPIISLQYEDEIWIMAPDDFEKSVDIAVVHEHICNHQPDRAPRIAVVRLGYFRLSKR